MRLLILLIVMLCHLPAALCAESLEGVLARMDEAAASFSGVKTKVEKTTYTAVINDSGVETGIMWMSRSASRSKDVRVRIAFTQPDERTLTFHGRKAEIYYPKIKTVHEYDLGKHRALIEQFLLLGFGTTGKKLAKEFQLRLGGEATVAGKKTTRLELTPKSRKARETLTKVELWIADQGGYPVQQKFHWPSEDTSTITYSDIELNPELSDKDVTLQLPAGVKREFPQR